MMDNDLLIQYFVNKATFLSLDFDKQNSQIIELNLGDYYTEDMGYMHSYNNQEYIMDLEKGRQIFFRFRGSRFYIDRECPDEYKKCAVPKSIEQQWVEEIKIDLLSKIKAQKGCCRVALVNRYIPLLDNELAVEFLIEELNKKDLDTFSMIILLERLKQYLSCNLSEATAKKVENTLAFCKKIMLTQKIEIDDQYKSLSYMADYDFFNENILKRINRI